MEIKISASPDRIFDLDQLVEMIKRNKAWQAVSKLSNVVKSFQKSMSSGNLRRSLMGFDQLNRLTAKSGGKAEEGSLLKIAEFISSGSYRDAVQQVLDKAMAFGNWFMGARDSAQDLGQLLEQVAGNCSGLASRMGSLKEFITNAAAGVVEFSREARDMSGQLTNMEQSAEDAGEGIHRAFGGLSAWFNGTVYSPIKTDIANLWTGMEPEAKRCMRSVQGLFQDTGNSMSTVFSDAWSKVKAVFSGGGEVYEGLTDGVLEGFRRMVNNLISGVNKTVLQPFSGINSLFTKLKDFTVGDMKPFKNLSFSIPMPQIPMLAQGAVLPANKPFMAVVGDQRHGTNIEAPLDVIRQAVAEVMEESVDAQLAGHSATVEVLKQILEAVLGISLDDGAVTRAVERHQQRLAVMRGGF